MIARRHVFVLSATALAIIALLGCSANPSRASTPAAGTDAAAAAASSTASGTGQNANKQVEATAPHPIEVSITGKPSISWTRADLDRVPKVSREGSLAKDGDARDTWSLRDLAHTLVGPTARVVSVTGAEETKAIASSEWEDTKLTPILHATRRGLLKFRWMDAQGKWTDTNVRDVKGITIEP